MKATWTGALAMLALSNAAWAQQDLENRVRELEKKMEKQKSDDTSTFRVFWKDGLNMETADKRFKFNVGGRVHIDAGYADYGENFQRRFARDHHFEEGILFRRARLQVGGTIWQTIVWKAEFDFAGGAVAPTDVFIGAKDLPLGEYVTPDFTVGHFKEPFSLEELTSSRFITFVERSLLNNAFTPARNIGLMVNDSIADRVTWAVGIFKDTPAAGNSQGAAQDGRWAFTARFTGLPWYEDGGTEVLHLGAAIRTSLPGAPVQFAARPESRISTANPTGAVPAVAFPVKDVDHQIQCGFELAVVYGPVWLQAEYMMVTVDHETSLEPTFCGYYISAGFFLTGESRHYKPSTGAFDRQKVAAPLFDGQGGCGAVEIAARLSWLDLSDDGLSGDEHRGITVALNWYLNPNTRVMIDYVLYDVFGPDAQAGILTIRFSIDW